jgi:hypothetical protein
MQFSIAVRPSDPIHEAEPAQNEKMGGNRLTARRFLLPILHAFTSQTMKREMEGKERSEKPLTSRVAHIVFAPD